MPSPLNRTLRLTEEDYQESISTLSSPLFASLASGIYQGDALQSLQLLPDNSFTLIIADPPYNFGRDFGNDSDKREEEEYVEWLKEWIALLPQKLTANGSVYICCDWQHSGVIEQFLRTSGLHVLNRITWKRDKGRGALRNWKQNMEDIWFAVKDKKEYLFNLEEVKVYKPVIAPYRENGKPKDWQTDENGKPFRLTHPSNIWTDLTVPFWSMPENTPHPTQKPELLIERIVLASSNPGDRVLDLFSGSGTTSVIAKRHARAFIGIELNEEYIRLGNKRLHREVIRSSTIPPDINNQ